MLTGHHLRNVAILALGVSSACARSSDMPSASVADSAWTTTPSGLRYQVVDAGTGPIAAAGEQAFIHETMSVIRDTILVDTWALNSPIEFLLGARQVVDGVDEGVTGMRVGERRRLIVPPALAKRDVTCSAADPKECPTPVTLYGENDTLQYEITLLRVRKP